MKKYLLPQQGQFFKANLHCHSTVSDGKRTPEEIKRDYMARGYSIVAYTDHEVMVPHHDLTDEEFLALTGYEMEAPTPRILPGSGEVILYHRRKNCHMCFIALDPDKKEQVCYHREKYVVGGALQYRDRVCFDESLPDYERVYSHEGISDMMRIGRENGFFVTYNHPNWSLADMTDYMGYEHMHAMEICNNGSAGEGYPDDYNGREYDHMLRGGKRIYCIATDDNHKLADCFGGFTVIKADRLDYKTVTDALLAGHFYASRGPAIHELWFEDGKLHITCSDARRIIMSTGIRTTRVVNAQPGQALNAAEFEVHSEDVYVRLTVWDDKGMYAATNAYFVDELLGQ